MYTHKSNVYIYIYECCLRAMEGREVRAREGIRQRERERDGGLNRGDTYI